MVDIRQVDVRTSWWWACCAAGFLYFAYLAIRRFLDGKTRGRAAIMAFSITWAVLSVTAILIRTNTVNVHDEVTEARTFLAAVGLWWMIAEFRIGNIRTPSNPKDPTHGTQDQVMEPSVP